MSVFHVTRIDVMRFYLQLNISKTKGPVADFRKWKSPKVFVKDCRTTGTWTAGWAGTPGRSREQPKSCFLKRPRSFDVCTKVPMFSHSLSCVMVAGLNKPIRRAAPVSGVQLRSLLTAAEERMLGKLAGMLGNASHSPHCTLSAYQAPAAPRSSTKRHRRSFLPEAITLIISSHFSQEETSVVPCSLTNFLFAHYSVFFHITAPFFTPFVHAHSLQLQSLSFYPIFHYTSILPFCFFHLYCSWIPGFIVLLCSYITLYSLFLVYLSTVRAAPWHSNFPQDK